MKDQYKLKPDGEVRFVFDGEIYNLRRPYFLELRERREALISDEDEAVAIAIAEGDTPEAPVLARIARREVRTQREDDLMKWWRDTVTLLEVSDKVLGEQLPSWFAADDIIAELLSHWRKTPADPGS